MLKGIKDILSFSAKCDIWRSANSDYYPQTSLNQFNPVLLINQLWLWVKKSNCDWSNLAKNVITIEILIKFDEIPVEQNKFCQLSESTD